MFFSLIKEISGLTGWWLKDPGWPGWNPVPFCRDPGSVINHILRFHAYKEKLKENVYKSKQLPGQTLSRLAGMKFDVPM